MNSKKIVNSQRSQELFRHLVNSDHGREVWIEFRHRACNTLCVGAKPLRLGFPYNDVTSKYVCTVYKSVAQLNTLVTTLPIKAGGNIVKPTDENALRKQHASPLRLILKELTGSSQDHPIHTLATSFSSYTQTLDVDLYNCHLHLKTAIAERSCHAWKSHWGLRAIVVR